MIHNKEIFEYCFHVILIDIMSDFGKKYPEKCFIKKILKKKKKEKSNVSKH